MILPEVLQKIVDLKPVYAAFDPGKSTGFALADADGVLMYLDTIVGHDNLTDTLQQLPDTIEQVILEKWVTNNRVKLSGSKMEVSQAQGAIKTWARIKGIPYKEQPNTCKRIGYVKLKTKPPGTKRLEHQWDAAAHLEYWLWNNKRGKKYASKVQHDIPEHGKRSVQT